jgi:hypothetical protein
MRTTRNIDLHVYGYDTNTRITGYDVKEGKIINVFYRIGPHNFQSVDPTMKDNAQRHLDIVCELELL